MKIKSILTSLTCVCMLVGCALPKGTPGEAVNPAIVDFYSLKGDTTPFATKKVTPGKSVENPGSPSKDNKTFLGWSQSNSKDDIWLFSTPIPTDATLINFYGVWEDVISEISVNFYVDYPALYDSKTATPGGLIEEPTAPEKAGKTFAGWTLDDVSNIPWDFANDTVPSDQKLDLDFYVIWSDAPISDVTISFYLDASSTTPYIENQIKQPGETVNKPATDPSKSGYTFNGWVIGSGTSIVSFPYTVPNNLASIRFNGSWSEVTTTYSVEYYRLNTDTSPFVTQNDVKIGDKLTHPGVPLEVSGKAFVGYQKQGETERWNFTTRTLVSSDFTNDILKLYAAWEDGFRIYFQAKEVWKQGTTYSTAIYLWKGVSPSSVEKAPFPGEGMNFVKYYETPAYVGDTSDYNIYSYDIITSEGWENVIFARINQDGTFATYQTVDIALSSRSTNNAYWINDTPTDNKFSGGWFTYTAS